MRSLLIALASTMLILNAGAFEITILGYEGGNVTVNIIPMENGTFAENITVQNDVIRIQNITNGSYHVVVIYGQKQYVSTISIPENSSLKIDFSETDDPGVLKVNNIHFILNLQQGGFSVMEVVNFVNTAEVYYHGDIVKQIPVGAANTAVDEETLAQSGVIYDRMILESGKIIIKNATVPPGTMFPLAYLYSPGNQIQLIVDYPSDVIRIIYPDQISITPPKGFQQETQITNERGIVFNVLKAENLSEGTYSLDAEIPQQIQSPPVMGEDQKLNLPLVVGVALIGAGIVLFIWTSRKKDEEEEEESEEEKKGGWNI